jgi:predicted CoA-binding protein
MKRSASLAESALMYDFTGPSWQDIRAYLGASSNHKSGFEGGDGGRSEVMSSQQLISEFLSHRKLALVGVSRSGRKFGNLIFKELKTKGYQVYPVHPQVPAIDGQSCWPNVLQLPKEVEGVVIVVPPAQTEKVVKEAATAGISRVWMQQGSESTAAIRFCEENGIQAVSGQCILMFLEPAAFLHRAHRWLWRILGKLPR